MIRMWSDRPSLGLAFSYNLVPADGFLVILITCGLIEQITELPITKLFFHSRTTYDFVMYLNSMIIMLLIKGYSLSLQVGVSAE